MRVKVDDRFGDNLVRYMPDLYRYALSLSGKTIDAEELVQETMRKALDLRSQYKEGTDIRSWLFSLQFNAHRSMVKQAFRRRNRETFDPDAAEAFPTPANQYDYLLYMQAEELIEQLPRDQKQALYCVVFEGLSYQQTAEKLACSEGTVKSRIARARAFLIEMTAEPAPQRQLAAAPRM
ncbi:RNA polymerase sigma factor [Pararhizobium sp. BT-229]|uniref:RNA polymerase sigma factor n=1 Tax=Pararhizobium sp. BT-229 TaxID=2986923 RepID=UPI0021F7A833|nr:RNA polymerase sigma factor [Pararhizobium sp. BT-229]MCV9965141.1 RNA polymerase sigma factor [Pararhizobium sp. BT-229]